MGKIISSNGVAATSGSSSSDNQRTRAAWRKGVNRHHSIMSMYSVSVVPYCWRGGGEKVAAAATTEHCLSVALAVARSGMAAARQQHRRAATSASGASARSIAKNNA